MFVSDACFTDKTCSMDDKRIPDVVSLDFYNLMNYQSEYVGDK